MIENCLIVFYYFKERVERELDLLVNKDRFFSMVRNVSSIIQYDLTRSSFVQVTDSGQLNSIPIESAR